MLLPIIFYLEQSNILVHYYNLNHLYLYVKNYIFEGIRLQFFSIFNF